MGTEISTRRNPSIVTPQRTAESAGSTTVVSSGSSRVEAQSTRAADLGSSFEQNSSSVQGQPVIDPRSIQITRPQPTAGEQALTNLYNSFDQVLNNGGRPVLDQQTAPGTVTPQQAGQLLSQTQSAVLAQPFNAQDGDVGRLLNDLYKYGNGGQPPPQGATLADVFKGIQQGVPQQFFRDNPAAATALAGALNHVAGVGGELQTGNPNDGFFAKVNVPPQAFQNLGDVSGEARYTGNSSRTTDSGVAVQDRTQVSVPFNLRQGPTSLTASHQHTETAPEGAPNSNTTNYSVRGTLDRQGLDASGSIDNTRVRTTTENGLTTRQTQLLHGDAALNTRTNTASVNGQLSRQSVTADSQGRPVSTSSSDLRLGAQTSPTATTVSGSAALRNSETTYANPTGTDVLRSNSSSLDVNGQATVTRPQTQADGTVTPGNTAASLSATYNRSTVDNSVPGQSRTTNTTLRGSANLDGAQGNTFSVGAERTGTTTQANPDGTSRVTSGTLGASATLTNGGAADLLTVQGRAAYSNTLNGADGQPIESFNASAQGTVTTGAAGTSVNAQGNVSYSNSRTGTSVNAEGTLSTVPGTDGGASQLLGTGTLSVDQRLGRDTSVGASVTGNTRDGLTNVTGYAQQTLARDANGNALNLRLSTTQDLQPDAGTPGNDTRLELRGNLRF